MRRLVIDATTLVSGSANPHGESPPSILYTELGEARFEPIACPRLLEEIERGLRKPYFQAKVSEEGDKDLLEHAGELEPRVLSPREACELIGLI